MLLILADEQCIITTFCVQKFQASRCHDLPPFYADRHYSVASTIWGIAQLELSYKPTYRNFERKFLVL